MKIEYMLDNFILYININDKNINVDNYNIMFFLFLFY